MRVLAVVIVSVAVALGLAEGAMRWSRAKPGDQAGKPLTYHIDYVRNGPGWTFAPNGRFWFIDERNQRVDIAADAFGYRNPPTRIAESEVWVIGDSFVAAVNTAEEETLVGRLRAAGIPAYNAGTDGTGTLQQLAQLSNLLSMAPRKPKAVVLALYLGNDFFDNLHAAASPSFTAAPGGAAPSGGAGLYASLRAVCEALETCKAVHRVAWLGWVKGYGRDPWFNARWVEFKLLEGVAHPRADTAIAATKTALQGFATLAAREKFRVLVIGIPSAAQAMESLAPILASGRVGREEAAAALPAIRFDRLDSLATLMAGEAGIEYLSLMSALRPDTQRYFGQVDFHWNAAGQERAAEFVAPVLRRMMERAP
ncbi:MAG: hypothetical protein FJX47_05500 [Alphaproteobacteria bacterium]|nr:hypothetical protein [Alphaproteobacteria bacterium]